MNLKKVSKRALRRKCSCADPPKRWLATDLDNPMDGVSIEVEEDSAGNLILHECVDEDIKQTEEEDLSTKTKDPRLEALDVLLQGSVVDEKAVERIVEKKLSESDRPTKTVIVKPKEEPREIEGLTHQSLAEVITATIVDHVMLIGPAGTGKSTIARQTAESLGMDYYSMSMGPQTSQTAFLGFVDGHGTYHSTVAREAIETGGLLCLDELDNAHPSVMTMLNAMLSGDPVAFPDGKRITPHADFRVVGTANTYGLGATREYVGRQALDQAFLDRFAQIDIPVDEALESNLARLTDADEQTVTKVVRFVRKVRANAEKAGVKVVVSPRASIQTCALIAAGMDYDTAVKARIRRSLDDSTWERLTK